MSYLSSKNCPGLHLGAKSVQGFENSSTSFPSQQNQRMAQGKIASAPIGMMIASEQLHSREAGDTTRWHVTHDG
jgi:hypothetical protein